MAPGSVTVQDWAYENTGAAINTGATGVATPVPSTASLAILVVGAAGIIALRRRRLKAN